MGNDDAAPIPPAGKPRQPEEGAETAEGRLARLRGENQRQPVRGAGAGEPPKTPEHRAALNLLENAVDARRRADLLNAQLRDEIERRRQVQEALHESRERLHLALGAASMGTFVWHVREDRAEPDAQMERLLGLRPGQGISLPEAMATMIHPADREAYAAAVERALDPAGAGIFREDVRICLSEDGGACRWLSVNGRVYFEGEPRRAVRVAGAVLDVTARKQAEETLRTSEERFRVALEAAEMAAWDYDVGRDRAVWNAQHFRLLGMEPRQEEVTAEDFLGAVHPEDLERVRARLREAIEKTGVYQADFRIVRADTREVRWMSGFGRAMSWANGHATRMTGVMFDVTDRHLSEEKLAQAQERLHLIVESALEHAILSLDMERRVTSWNRGAENLHGYTKAEIIGQSVDIIFTPNDRATGVPAREQRMALEQGYADDNRWMQRKDGTRFWASGAMLPMRSRRDGEIIGFVKILRDQTEMHRAREAQAEALRETQRARAESEAAGRAKDQFLAVLSHELRTPLTPVLMATHALARRTDLPAPVREALRMIQRNIQLEARFVDDLLDVTRISRGKLELVRAPMDVHEAITEAVEICRPEIEAKGQVLTVELEAREHRIHGDAPRMQQVMWNLLKNASKFTPRGGGVRIRTCNPPGEGRMLRVEVTDTGIGLEAEALSRIFDAFTQADAEIARKFGGLGLGLAIARATVLAHGGDLSVESAGLGKGATFTASMPLDGEGAEEG